MRFFPRRHTPEEVARRLIDGLEDGTLTVGEGAPDEPGGAVPADRPDESPSPAMSVGEVAAVALRECVAVSVIVVAGVLLNAALTWTGQFGGADDALGVFVRAAKLASLSSLGVVLVLFLLADVVRVGRRLRRALRHEPGGRTWGSR